MIETKNDVLGVLTCVDYDFDEAGRHEETLEAYNRIRPLLKAAPDLLDSVYDMVVALEALHLHPDGVFRARAAIAKAEGKVLR